MTGSTVVFRDVGKNVPDGRGCVWGLDIPMGVMTVLLAWIFLQDKTRGAETRSVCVYTRGFEHQSNAIMDEKMGDQNSHSADGWDFVIEARWFIRDVGKNVPVGRGEVKI